MSKHGTKLLGWRGGALVEGQVHRAAAGLQNVAKVLLAHQAIHLCVTEHTIRQLSFPELELAWLWLCLYLSWHIPCERHTVASGRVEVQGEALDSCMLANEAARLSGSGLTGVAFSVRRAQMDAFEQYSEREG